MKPPDTILVIVTRRIGDVLMATPLIRSLRTAWPAVSLDVLTYRSSCACLAANPDIRSILTIEENPAISSQLVPIQKHKILIKLEKKVNKNAFYSGHPVCFMLLNFKERHGFLAEMNHVIVRTLFSHKDSPLKIAVLVKRFIRSGGSERYAVEVARRLKARGHEIQIYSRYVDKSLLEGMRHIRVPDRHTYSSVASSLSFARETARLLRGEDYDIVHSHERGYRQDVMTIHTFSYRSGLARHSFFRRIDQTYLSLRSAIYLWLERKQMSSPGLVAVSGRIQEDIRKNYKRTERVRVITPGVDLDVFHPEEMERLRKSLMNGSGATSSDLTILFVGGEFRRKGLDRLIPAIGDRMRLIVVGRGERLDHYRKLAAECGASDRIRFVGHVCGDIREYYALADVVVLPSLSEAFGMSILEAMACGLPVIANPSTGVADLIEDGKSGLLACETNQLNACLIRLKKPVVREEMGKRARQVAEDYSWDSVASEYESFFTDIVNYKG